MTQRNAQNRPGLVLLIVLGMLALFSILAVSFVVFSGNSKDASVSISRAKQRTVDTRALADSALMNMLRGTNTPLENVFDGHTLLGDIYSSDPIVSLPFSLIDPGRCLDLNSAIHVAGEDNVIRVLGENVGGGTVPTPFIKIPLARPRSNTVGDASGPLPMPHDALTGRLITFVTGPLRNETFRILKYVGGETQVPATGGTTLEYLNYSILISLAELKTDQLTSELADGSTVTRSVGDWVGISPNTLCYEATDFNDLNTYFRRHEFVINGATFNGVGTGMVTDATRPHYYGAAGPELNLQWGNIGKSAFVDPDPTNIGRPATPNPDPAAGIPLQLLHRYLYELDGPGNEFAWQDQGNNEGYDVPDFRDWFMGYYPPADVIGSSVSSNDIIPAMHRPAVINLIVNHPAYRDPTNLTLPLAQRMLNLLDAATPRPLNIRYGNNALGSRNVAFNPTPVPDTGLAAPFLIIDPTAWSPNPSGPEIAKLQAFVSWLTNGPWDVDNDGDGIADSVWTNANLPLVSGKDGSLLKPMVATMVRDQDSRINLNTAGDLVQIDGGYLLNETIAFTPTNAAGNPTRISQGLGYGPSDISFAHLLRPATGNAIFPLFAGRYYDGSPGRGAINDPVSTFFELTPDSHLMNDATGTLTNPSPVGLPLARRGAFAMGMDRFGNPRIRKNLFTGNVAGQNVNDPYELSPLKDATSDELYSFAELDRLLSLYSTGLEMLPDRLESRLLNQQVNADIRRLVTTRSAEISSPSIAGVTAFANNNDAAPNPSQLLSRTGSLLGMIRMLHEERYRNRGQLTLDTGTGRWVYPAFDTAIHDPPMNALVIRDLFPSEFRHNLRMNLNRPTATPLGGNGFARHLYCLAQLIVPRTYALPGQQGQTLGSPEFASRRARILAQWAVNVIDFRDGDPIMSRFEYDEMPFGRPGTPFNVVGTNPGTVAEGREPGWNPQDGNVVWGMEFPEVLLSEVVSFHDLRVRDTDVDTSGEDMDPAGPMPDTDFDQYRIPEGSTFFELFCPRTTEDTANGTLPNDWVANSVSSLLYTLNGGVPELNLSAVTPTNNDPVFRIGISAPYADGQSVAGILNRDGPDGEETSATTYQVQRPAQSNVNGLAPKLAGTPAGGIEDTEFDRVVIFTAATPTAMNDLPMPFDDRRIFRRRAGNFTIEGGGYMVVGPRPITYLGSQDTAGATPNEHNPSPQRIVLDSSVAESVATYGFDDVTTFQEVLASAGARGLNAAAKQPRVMIVGADTPNPGIWRANKPFVGINISEPLSNTADYYPRPTHEVDSSNTGGPPAYPGYGDGDPNLLPDGYRDFAGAGTGNLPDEPFDATNPNLIVTHGADPEVGIQVGTRLNVRTAYLQRLADPTQDFNADTNPYITIDWMGMDLSVFSGEDDAARNAANQFAFQTRYRDGASIDDAHDQSDSMTLAAPPPINTADPLHRAAETGFSFMSASTARMYQSVAYTGPNTWDGNTASPSFFSIRLGATETNPDIFPSSSLGFLNVGRPIADDATAVANNEQNATEGFGFPLQLVDPQYAGFIGAPRQKIASLYWFNRPFANGFELMMVPHTGPGELSRQFTINKAISPYSADTDNLSDGFGYLLNYFDSSQMKSTSSATATNNEPFWMRPASPTQPDIGGDFNVLLDLVDTPVLYMDSAIHYAPDTYRLPPNIGTPSRAIRATMLDDMRDTFVGNQLSYRTPGKLNLNTISDGAVWKGLEYNYLKNNGDRDPFTASAFENVPGLGFFNDNDATNVNTFADFRRGYTTNGNTDSSQFVTNPLQKNPNLSFVAPSQFMGVFRSGIGANITPQVMRNPYSMRSVNSGLLRQGDPNIASNAPPLIRSQNLDPANFGGINDRDTNHGQVQPYEAYRRLMRLPNLTSQQSNVFEVRVTIGLFEYDAATGIGREHLDSNGQPQRHQAIYFIDRSIPVAFVPGEDINTANAIVYRRHLD
jgi:hypothetical protein